MRIQLAHGVYPCTARSIIQVAETLRIREKLQCSLRVACDKVIFSDPVIINTTRRPVQIRWLIWIDLIGTLRQIPKRDDDFRDRECTNKRMFLQITSREEICAKCRLATPESYLRLSRISAHKATFVTQVLVSNQLLRSQRLRLFVVSRVSFQYLSYKKRKRNFRSRFHFEYFQIDQDQTFRIDVGIYRSKPRFR